MDARLVVAVAVAAALGGARADDAQVDRGRYLARAGDCIGCHTAPDGQPFAGGYAVETGFGKIYTPNITPDRQTGIGKWSADDLWRAMHHGVDDEGRHLYPAFPYPWFTKATRGDVDALKAFLDTVPPVRQANKPPQLPWWMAWRFEVAGWNLLWFDEGGFKPDPARSEQWNRGAYLVEGLGHCGDCHTPKNELGGADADRRLAGGYTEGGHHNGWYAPALTNSRRAGLADWSADDIARYLKTGSNAHTAAAGPMVEVIANSTSHLSDTDLQAMAVYLKSQPARAGGDATITPLARPTLERGQALFTDNCAACHMHDGTGIRDFFPALAGSSTIQAGAPATVLRIVLDGARVPAQPGQRAYVAMPGFADKLSDADIAAVVSYIRNAWGNRASAVDVAGVAQARRAVAGRSPSTSP